MLLSESKGIVNPVPVGRLKARLVLPPRGLTIGDTRRVAEVSYRSMPAVLVLQISEAVLKHQNAFKE